MEHRNSVDIGDFVIIDNIFRENTTVHGTNGWNNLKEDISKDKDKRLNDR